MLHEHRPHDTAPVEGSSDRTFGLVFCAFFALVGLFPLLHGGPARPWALAVAAVFLLVALVRPSLLALPNRLWTRLGLLMHGVVGPVALAILFYGVFTPIGGLMRLLGKDPLHRRFDREAVSYWVTREPPGPAPDSMKNQF